MISIVDYGLGNIQAIKNIYKQLNIPCEAVTTPEKLAVATKIVLPGVGAFDDAMCRLENSNMLDVLNDCVLIKRIPVMGICVGMQIMARSSDEGEKSGLGWIDANVKKFDMEKIGEKPKVPHMGWNEIDIIKEDRIVRGIDKKLGFYFLHSYYFQCEDGDHAIAYANYGDEFVCAVRSKNVYGFQFHPEKSHSNGIVLFENFSEL